MKLLELRLNKNKEVEPMHFSILGFRNDSKCEVEVVKADRIEIKRNLSKIFTFKDAESFIGTLIGHGYVAVYICKEANGTENTENWRAFFIEPSEPRKDDYGSGMSILPAGTLAILEMDTEFDLEWALKEKAQEAATYVELFRKIESVAKKIYRIDSDHKYADTDQFRYMNPEELEKALEEVQEAYKTLTVKGDVEL